MDVSEYSKRTKASRKSFKAESIEEYEELFWSSLDQSPPLYGSDIKGSLFEDRDKAGAWDLRHLSSCLSDGMGGVGLSGINMPYLYFGSFRTIFAWHVEDYNMSSINFQHLGSPKVWYGVSRRVAFNSQDHRKFENYVKQKYPFKSLECNQFIRHKTFLVDPYLIRKERPDIKIHK